MRVNPHTELQMAINSIMESPGFRSTMLCCPRLFQILKQMLLFHIVFCVSVSGEAHTGALRLINGPGVCAGTVEIFHDNKWGSVCDDFWDSRDAEVVCRQLACGSALFALGSAFYGPGNGDIWMDDVKCTGSEFTLSDCPHNGWGMHNCYMNEVASVICSDNLPAPTISVVNRSGEVELHCIMPKLFLNVTIYLLDMQTNVTKANATLIQRELPYVDKVATFPFSGAKQGGVAQYACRYEASNRKATFTSPWSEPVCIVYQESNGTKKIEILHNLCADGPENSGPITGTTTPGQAVATSSGQPKETTGGDGTPTTASTNQTILVTLLAPYLDGQKPTQLNDTETTGGDGTPTTASTNETILVTLLAPYLDGQKPTQLNDTGLALTISLVVAFTVLLMVLLMVFFFHRAKRSSLTQRDKAEENQYTNSGLNPMTIQTIQEKAAKSKTNLEVKMPPKEETLYEDISDPPNDGYENTIFYIDVSGPYESLNDSTKSNDIYQVIR